MARPRAPSRIAAHNGARIWGGAEIATVRLLRGLAGRGHEALLLCNDEVVLHNARLAGIEAQLCLIGGDIALPHAFRLSRKLRNLAPTSFIIGTWRKLFLAALGARIARVPRVIARVGLETDTPRSAKYRFALRRWVDSVVVNSPSMLASFETLDRFGTARVSAIRNGVRVPAAPPSRVRARAALGLPDSLFIVGTVARLAQQKRLDRMLAAMSLMDPDTSLVIVGDGPDRSQLEQESIRRGLSTRVKFLGHRQDPAEVVPAFDVFALTSDREGSSNAMLEAMALGVPVVSTRVSGSSDALCGEHPAGIVTGFSEEEVASAIRSLRNDPSRRKLLGAGARETIQTRFGFEAMLDRWEEVLAGESVTQ